VKQVIGLSVLLGVALVGSYLTWTDDSEEVDDDAVVVYNAGETDVQSVTWTSEEAVVVVERRTDEVGPFFWVTATDRKKKKLDKPEDEDAEGTEDDEAEDDPAAEEDDPHAGLDLDEEEDEGVEGVDYEIEETTRTFKGNDAADKLWAGFTPLEALRELKPSGDVDRGTFGLDEPTATVEVVRKSGPVTLSVGGQTYGTRDRYVDYDGRIFLVADATLRPLQYGSSRLLDRQLMPLAEADIEQVQVQLPSETVTLVQQNADDKAQAYWARAETPETADDAAGVWVGKVFRLRLTEYVADDAVEGPLTPLLSYEVTGDGQTWRVELLEGGGDHTYARSTFSRSLVELTPSLASNVLDDLDALTP
jgi:hypothetical protein